MRGGLGWIVVALAALALAAPADARSRKRDDDAPYRGRVPELDVKGSCRDAQKFSTGSDKDIAYKGCLQDEMEAKTQLDKRWNDFKGKDRSNCVEQSRFPSPSYVEVLTCLEMDTDAIRNAPRGPGGQPAPQIGGPVAPGLSTSPVPSGTMPGATPNR